MLPRSEDHDGLAGGLLQLDLDGGELLLDDVHHSLNFLPQETHMKPEVQRWEAEHFDDRKIWLTS